MKAPPSRYRVVERGGRLVVIDSAVGGAPLAAKDLLSAMASDDRADALSLGQYPRAGGDPEQQVPAPETQDPRLRGDTEGMRPPSRPGLAQSMIAEPPGALRSVAETVAGGKRDGDGRLLLTTARFYDAKGPRTLALRVAAERQFGGAVLALAGAAIVAIFLMVMGEVFGWIIVFGVLFLLGRAKPIATAWIDRLAAG